MLEVFLLGVCAFLAFSAPGFLTLGNLMVVLSSVAPWGLIAFGMTMVIVAGEIDLSVGSAVALSGCLVAWLIEAGLAVPAAMLAALAAGAALGALAGLVRAWFQVPSFITTLALLSALRGAALLLAPGGILAPFPQWYFFLGSGYLGEIPFPGLVFLACFAVVHFLMNYTALGRAIYAVGGNVEAAHLSGIPVTLVRMTVLASTGFLAAVGGIIVSAQLESAKPDKVGLGWELDVIAAVIIGGSSLSGGAGTAWGTLVGVVFIGVILNGMTLLGVRTDNQYIVRGAIILGAVLVNQLQKRKQ
jgi:ribose/xylose/arabinose/galactoside ABC-type transport system permease subunit